MESDRMVRARDLVRAATGIALESTMYTGSLTVGYRLRRGYDCVLIGPFEDPLEPDIRVYITHRLLDGSETVTLLLQDKDDDAWLNSGHPSCGMVSNMNSDKYDKVAGFAYYAREVEV
jgi:hypothetical protein